MQRLKDFMYALRIADKMLLFVESLSLNRMKTRLITTTYEMVLIGIELIGNKTLHWTLDSLSFSSFLKSNIHTLDKTT